MPTNESTSYDLLSERLLQVRLSSGDVEHRTLPELLMGLQQGEISSFPGLRPHQGPAWHAFLVQLAAMATHRFGRAADADQWRENVLGLTDGMREPWCLLVSDLSAPAFLQPPVPEGSLAKWKGEAGTPDQIDVIITAKNHDLKSKRMIASGPEQWLFALLLLQTQQGFLGAGNYGIARMNSGFGSKPFISLAPSLDPSERFRRDLEVLLSGRQQLVDEYEYMDEAGVGLLWLLPWDGTGSLPLASCDPFFIEVCRRVRLLERDGDLVAQTTTSKTSRIAAKESKGNTGDPWTPVREGTALTVSGGGFNYTLLHEVLLGGNIRPGLALKPQTSDPRDLLLLASVLVRGQGTTEGFHERVVPVPGKITLRLGNPEEREALGRRAKERVEKANTARLRVLKPSLLALLQSGPEKLDWKDDRPDPTLARFEEDVDVIFFEELWKDADLPPEEEIGSWERKLAELAKTHFENALGSLPLSSARSYRARAAAERTFYGARRKHLPASVALPKEGAVS